MFWIGRKRQGAVRYPVGRGHLAAGEEGGTAGEETDHHQDAADQFDGAGAVDDVGGDSCRHAGRETEELLDAVPEEEKADDDPHQRISLGTVARHEWLT